MLPAQLKYGQCLHCLKQDACASRSGAMSNWLPTICFLTSRGCVTDGGSESNPQEAQTCSITFKTTSKQNTLLMAVNCSLVLPPTILTFGSAISTWLYTIVSLSAVEARVHKSGHRVLRSKLFVLEATPLGAQTSTTGQSIHFPWLYHPAVKLEL